ncbi:DUF885 domain-containing protein [Pseudonocardiaceae bacterium YIM PH 21723]|nr:DUF885 domain-containing protein [Pseudonocardiaceae bacterium YIM PH 21723]
MHALADELVAVQFDHDPLEATLYGDRARDHQLPESSTAADDEFLRRCWDIAARAEAVDPSTVDETDRVTRSVILDWVRNVTGYVQARTAEYTVTDLFNAPAAGLLMGLSMISLPEPQHPAAYLERLGQVPRYLEQALQRHRDGITEGLAPVGYLVQNAIDALDRYLDNPDRDPLLRPAPVTPDDDFEQRRAEVLETVVRPAFAAYRDGLREHVLPFGRTEDAPGLTHLPGGRQLYIGLARFFTTTERTPEELHQTGLDIVAELAKEYSELGQRIFGVSEVPEIFQRLRTDPELRFSSAEEILDKAKAAMERAVAAAPQFFGRLPQAPCAIEEVPADSAPGSPLAYYLPPAADGSRPGTYFQNTHNATGRDRFSLEAVAFHEAIPGHHFQISVAQELTELPLLRRKPEFTAYIEGWGLYTERLADEMGLYTSDLDRFGILTYDSLRACRLVVDTGVHALGWTRQQAIDFMLANVPANEGEMITEVDRYIAMPGQALSYMVGRLEILRLRAKAKELLGESFSLSAFHDVVLGGGPLPLGVLDEVVTAWASRG